MDKVKVLSLMLHAADISHPAKAWPLHYRWTHSLMEEFFRQVHVHGKHDLFDCSGYSLVILWFTSYYSCLIPRVPRLIATWAFFLFGTSETSLLSTAVLCYSVSLFLSLHFYCCVDMCVCVHVFVWNYVEKLWLMCLKTFSVTSLREIKRWSLAFLFHRFVTATPPW